MAERERPPEDVQGDFEDLMMVTVQPDPVLPVKGTAKAAATKDRIREKWKKRT
ncbi:hypothetical protein [Paracoccus sp. (in: a-proteobacteria)]|uniref:hypothetical protein n=1 Tax=Paracoccus sp. TaxID=267 RepID=UPI003A8A02AB